MAKLSDFMLSKVRVELIELFFTKPSEMWYVRELTRLVGEEINAVRRELARMQDVGMVKSEERGNRLYYMLNPQYDFFNDKNVPANDLMEQFLDDPNAWVHESHV